MRDSKLFQLLKILPEAERKEFALFVASPYFNRISRLEKLLEVLEENLLRYKLRNISEEEAYALILPGQPFDQNRLRKDATALVRLYMRFLAERRFQNNEYLQSQYTLQSLYDFGADQLLANYHQQVMAAQEGRDLSSVEVQETLVQIGIIRYAHDLRQPIRDSDVNLDALIAQQERASLMHKMELCYMQLNHRLVTKKGQIRDDQAFLDEVQGQLSQLPSRTQMMYHLYRCTLNPALEDDYAQFKSLLANSNLEPQAQEDFYTAALNYCARRVNEGHVHFNRTTFEIYQEMLDKKVLENVSAMLSSHFKNIVVIASRLKEFAWARQFVEQYAPCLAGDFNKNAYHFALGTIAYSEKRFAEAESFLYRVLEDYEDIFYGIDARVALLRIHYETQNLIGLDSLTDSFRMYVKRNTQLNGQRKANLQAFIRHLKQLARIPQHDHSALKSLQGNVLNGRKYANMQWLLDKIDQRLKG